MRLGRARPDQKQSPGFEIITWWSPVKRTLTGFFVDGSGRPPTWVGLPSRGDFAPRGPVGVVVGSSGSGGDFVLCLAGWPFEIISSRTLRVGST